MLYIDGREVVWPRVAGPLVWKAEGAVYAATEEAAARRGQVRFPSGLEVELLVAFFLLGQEPELQVPVGPFDIDFLFDGHFVVEADGSRYHRDAAREERRDSYLRGRGLEVAHVQEGEVTRDPIRAAREALQRGGIPAHLAYRLSGGSREQGLRLIGPTVMDNLVAIVARVEAAAG
jgi:very-short-patch-repair endonuclease